MKEVVLKVGWRKWFREGGSRIYMWSKGRSE
jgi:hypothetical protein